MPPRRRYGLHISFCATTASRGSSRGPLLITTKRTSEPPPPYQTSNAGIVATDLRSAFFILISLSFLQRGPTQSRAEAHPGRPAKPHASIEEQPKINDSRGFWSLAARAGKLNLADQQKSRPRAGPGSTRKSSVSISRIAGDALKVKRFPICSRVRFQGRKTSIRRFSRESAARYLTQRGHAIDRRRGN
jgi:hypothetical protein